MRATQTALIVHCSRMNSSYSIVKFSIVQNIFSLFTKTITISCDANSFNQNSNNDNKIMTTIILIMRATIIKIVIMKI